MPPPVGALSSLVPLPTGPVRPDHRSHAGHPCSHQRKEMAHLHSWLLSSLFCSLGLTSAPSLPPCSWTWCDFDEQPCTPGHPTSPELWEKGGSIFAGPALPLGWVALLGPKSLEGSLAGPLMPGAGSQGRWGGWGSLLSGFSVFSPDFLVRSFPKEPEWWRPTQWSPGWGWGGPRCWWPPSGEGTATQGGLGVCKLAEQASGLSEV